MTEHKYTTEHLQMSAYKTDSIEFPSAAASTVVELIDRQIEALRAKQTKLRASRSNQSARLNRIGTQLRDLIAARAPLYDAERKHLDRIVDSLTPREPVRIRYATCKSNTTLSALRLGKPVDDTWRVTVYRDGVPESFTCHSARCAEIVEQFRADGFAIKEHSKDKLIEAWITSSVVGDDYVTMTIDGETVTISTATGERVEL